MMIKHILGQVAQPKAFEITISDEIEIVMSQLDNIENFIMDKLDIKMKGTYILSKDNMNIRYSPMIMTI